MEEKSRLIAVLHRCLRQCLGGRNAILLQIATDLVQLFLVEMLAEFCPYNLD